MATDQSGNPANWSRGPLKLYFSRDDTRLWVPKFRPSLGWTVNLAHPGAAALLLALLLVSIVVAATASGWR